MAQQTSDRRTGHSFWEPFWIMEFAIFTLVALVNWLVGLRDLQSYGAGLVLVGLFLLVTDVVSPPVNYPTIDEVGLRYGFTRNRSLDRYDQISRCAGNPHCGRERLRDRLACLIPTGIGLVLVAVAAVL